MPNLPPDPSSSVHGLREYLAGILPESQLTDASVHAGYEPLLLLRTKHVMAAFAFSNGDMTKSYDALYGSFKNYYSEQRGQWDALDLAFVFCVRPDVAHLDQFCSHVETDVYFCRKFVVPLADPLNQSLARLPFLPLSPLHGKSLRPPSAQTFLQRCGVPAVLAKYLVVQRERSAEGIVEDCTSGTFGQPRELMVRDSKRVPHVDRVGSPVRVGSVSIKNFRAYRKPQTFQLGADVTVLYGPNGFGKTSFFDAIDFAVTGEIGRMRSSGETHFRKTAKHLDSTAEESTVSLSFSSNGAVRRLTRKVSDRKYGVLDGRATDRKEILSELTSGDIPATDRVENFVSLFRATHLFSQEHQELAKDFQDDCELSEQIVSRLLAFEDYTNAANKASRVREIVEKAIGKADEDITELSQQIIDEQVELDHLAQTAQVHTAVDALDDAIDALRQRIRNAGILVDAEKQDVATIRGWRAALEAQHAESQRKVDRLSAVAKETGRQPESRQELRKLQQRLRESEQALATAEERRTAAEREVQAAEKVLAEVTNKRTEALAKRAVLQAVQTTRPAYTSLLEKEKQATQDLDRATTVLSDSRSSEAKAHGELQRRDTHAAQLSDRLKHERNELVKVQQLRNGFATWQANSAQLAALSDVETRTFKALEALAVEESNLSTELRALSGEEARLLEQIAQVDSSQSALRQLLSQLQQHVRTGMCPLCGEDHGSKDALLRRIEEQVALDAASSARRDLAGIKEKVTEISARLRTNKQRTNEEETNQTKAKNTRAKLAADIQRVGDAIAELGLDPSGATTLQQLQEQEEQLVRDVGELTQQVEDLTRELQVARTAIADANRATETNTTDVQAKQSALAVIREELKHLRGDRRFGSVSLDIAPESLAEQERLNVAELAALETELVTTQGAAERVRAPLTMARQQVNTIKADLTRLREEAARLEKSITEIGARLEEAGLPATADDKAVLALIAEATRAQAQFLELRDSAASIELAIDAATTAAALTRLRQNILNKEKAVATAKRTREQYGPWLEYFTSVSALIAAQQNEAIGHFTSQYGPRTSVIQRRLRAVYGFDDIEIQSHKSAIRVRVKRRGEELKPTDYFSQSQQQTLLLGLFLTACLSQTWSALSPVFLDDPVTHFDDLNTYAFLDLIVGLLESEVGRRQFVISTCDDKFLQLARQKFRHLGDRARYYSFSAIGADGPMVQDVSSSESDTSDNQTVS